MPTLLTVLMLPALVGLGLWQLARAEWKEELLAVLARNMAAPLLDLGSGPVPATGPDLRFRLVRIAPECPAQDGIVRAGRSIDGQGGYARILRCTAGGTPVLVDAGWQPRPGQAPVPALSGRAIEGRLVPVDREGAVWMLVASEGLHGLPPSAAPGPQTIPNNHRAYAAQWFGFALILLLVYLLWVRRWRARLEAPGPAA